MATNLIELAKGYLTSEVIQKASALVGESPTTTRKAMETATPTVVAGLAERGSSISGAQSVMGILEEAGLTGAVGPLTERLRGMSGEDLVQLGKDLLGRVFGARLGPVVEATAASSGVKPSAMSSLLGLATPVVLGVLGDQIHTRRLDASGLASLLAEQKSHVAAALPPAVSAALGGAGARVAAPRPTPREAPPPRESRSGVDRLWPLLLIPVLIIGGLLLRKREAPTVEPVPSQGLGAGIPEQAPSVEAPQVGAPPVVGELTQFLESSDGEPSKRFVLDDLSFEPATTTLTPASLAMLDSVARVLQAHPGALVAVEGTTERAAVVKNALAARGVGAERLTATGLGQDQPRAWNDTPEGRAKNRRIEIVVTR